MSVPTVGISGAGGITGVAVVIDVIRAFTFCAFCFDAGVERVILMDDLDECLAVARSIPGALAGKDGEPRPDFDVFNSPGQLLERDDLAGRTVVHRTGAGTRGAWAARAASEIWCASLVVASATADRVRGRDVTYVVTAGDGAGEDDLAGAELIAALAADPKADRLPFAEAVRTSPGAVGLDAGLGQGYTGVHPDDVALCCDVDRFDFAMRATLEDGLLVLRRDD